MGKHHARRRQRRTKTAIMSQVKHALLMDVSHEVRMSLSAIVGYSEMLLEEATECGYANLVPDLHKVRIAGSRILTLLHDIAMLASIESGSIEVCYEAFPLQCLLDHVLSHCQPLLAEHDNLLELDVAPEITVVHNDFVKLQRCLHNMVAYACMHTEQSTIRLRIWQDSQPDGRWLVFDVQAPGISIHSEQQHDMLYNMAHTHTVMARKYSGAGFGLALSRRFCQMLGGEITLRSTVGAGTVYTMRLPAQGTASALREGESDHVS